MKAPSNVQVLMLEGSPRERGLVHGEALGPQIREYISGWKNTLGEIMGMDPDVYIGQFLEETDFHSAVEQWTPDLLDEVRGIAEGSGMDWKTMFAHQLGDEEWWYRLHRRRRGQSSASQDYGHCTALGVSREGDNPPLLAQTWDLPEYYDGYQVLLHIKHAESALESFVVTIAGVIAANGLNNRSVAVCVNAMLELDHRIDGLPVDFVVRGILNQSTLDDAIAFIHRIKHASGQNYVIGGPERVADYECSANQVCQHVPNSGVGRVYHANRPMINSDRAMFSTALDQVPLAEKEVREKFQAHARRRYDFVVNQLSDASETITLQKVKSILSSHEAPVCCHKLKDLMMTAGCSIMELSDSPVLHFAPGPPCSTQFERYTF